MSAPIDVATLDPAVARALRAAYANRRDDCPCGTCCELSDALAAFDFTGSVPIGHIAETLAGAMEGRSDNEALEVNVGWLRALIGQRAA